MKTKPICPVCGREAIVCRSSVNPSRYIAQIQCSLYEDHGSYKHSDSSHKTHNISVVAYGTSQSVATQRAIKLWNL